MKLRPSLAHIAFYADEFRTLQAKFRSGELHPDRVRLEREPTNLRDLPEQDRDRFLHNLSDLSQSKRDQLNEQGRTALREGRVAAIVLNGGMATRFGGQPKGIVPLIPSSDHTFISLKLAQFRSLGVAIEGAFPITIMHSFATQLASEKYLKEINWMGILAEYRLEFLQSVLPRILEDGTPLVEHADSQLLPDTEVYCAPGHGDTLRMLRDSGTLDKLQSMGVHHLLVSNVDNLGATIDPIVLGAHLEACERGAELSVEIVDRRSGDMGGCVAVHEGKPVILEGFRLPKSTDLSRFSEFNTNTLWFSLPALQHPIELDWFPVRRSLTCSDGQSRTIVQFEQLIGQASERLSSHYIRVDRSQRFLPIKTRQDLCDAAPDMKQRIQSLLPTLRTVH